MGLMDEMREVMRRKQYAAQTEKTYVHWVERYIRYHGMRHPREMGAGEVQAFLTHLSVEGEVAAATQNQALNAIVFLYREVLGLAVVGVMRKERVVRPSRLPTVLTVEEVSAVLAAVDVRHHLAASLMYGAGLRVSECLGLRCKDVDVGRRRIDVQEPKGGVARATIMPERVVEAMERQLAHREVVHAKDLEMVDFRGALLPNALSRKFDAAPKALGWQYLFPSGRLLAHPDGRGVVRHAMHVSSVQRAVREAALGARIARPVSCHVLRHSFATHLLEASADVRTVQKLLEHKDLRTTMVYLHVTDRRMLGVRSPLDG